MGIHLITKITKVKVIWWFLKVFILKRLIIKNNNKSCPQFLWISPYRRLFTWPSSNLLVRIQLFPLNLSVRIYVNIKQKHSMYKIFKDFRAVTYLKWKYRDFFSVYYYNVSKNRVSVHHKTNQQNERPRKLFRVIGMSYLACFCFIIIVVPTVSKLMSGGRGWLCR